MQDAKYQDMDIKVSGVVTIGGKGYHFANTETINGKPGEAVEIFSNHIRFVLKQALKQVT